MPGQRLIQPRQGGLIRGPRGFAPHRRAMAAHRAGQTAVQALLVRAHRRGCALRCAFLWHCQQLHNAFTLIGDLYHKGIPMRLSLLLLASLTFTSAKAADIEFWPGARYDAAIPTIADVLGYESGKRITTHRNARRYFAALAGAAPGLIQLKP